MARERGGTPSETLMGLRRRLEALPRRDPGRRAEVGRIAELFGVSSSTVYRALASVRHPKGLRRADRSRPRATDRTSKFHFVALGDQRREFVRWLLETCLEDGADPDSVIAPQAQDFRGFQQQPGQRPEYRVALLRLQPPQFPRVRSQGQLARFGRQVRWWRQRPHRSSPR